MATPDLDKRFARTQGRTRQALGAGAAAADSNVATLAGASDAAIPATGNVARAGGVAAEAGEAIATDIAPSLVQEINATARAASVSSGVPEVLGAKGLAPRVAEQLGAAIPTVEEGAAQAIEAGMQAASTVAKPAAQVGAQSAAAGAPVVGVANGVVRAGDAGAKVVQTGAGVLQGGEAVVALGLGATGLAAKTGIKPIERAHAAIKSQVNRIHPEEVVKKNGLTKWNKISHGAWIAGAGLGIYNEVSHTAAKADAVAHYEADVTGKNVKDISTTQLLFGKSEDPDMQDIQSKFRWKFALRTALNVASTVVLWKSLKKPDMNKMVLGTAAFIPMIGTSAVDITVGDSVIKPYTLLKNAYATGQATPELYSALILKASHEVSKHSSLSDKMSKKLGQEYYDKHLDPKLLVQMIREEKNPSSEFRQDIESVLVQAEAEHAAELERHQQEQAVKAQHVQSLQALNKTDDKVSIGRHTNRENTKRRLAAMQQGAGQGVSA